jgi:lipoprotein NlpI
VAAGVAEVYRTRGMLRLEELNLDQAISDFDKAISLKPDQAENYFQRGTARLIDGDFNAAISDFGRCIQLHARYARAYLSRGVARMHQGNKREARRDFDKCLELKHEADLMLQMYILELETKIKQRRTRRSSQGDRIASGSANRRELS